MEKRGQRSGGAWGSPVLDRSQEHEENVLRVRLLNVCHVSGTVHREPFQFLVTRRKELIWAQHRNPS